VKINITSLTINKLKKEYKIQLVIFFLILLFASKIVFKLHFPAISGFIEFIKDGVLGIFLFLGSYLLYQKIILRKNLNFEKTILVSRKNNLERAIELKNYEYIKDLKVVESQIIDIDNQLNEMNHSIPLFEISLLVMTMITGALQVVSYLAK
jgi:hypothetical protein